MANVAVFVLVVLGQRCLMDEALLQDSRDRLGFQRCMMPGQPPVLFLPSHLVCLLLRVPAVCDMGGPLPSLHVPIPVEFWPQLWPRGRRMVPKSMFSYGCWVPARFACGTEQG